MRQAGGIYQVGIAAESAAELASDLRAFQRVRQPGAREVGLTDLDDLSLGREPAQRGTVQHPGAVPLERTAPGAVRALRRLGGEPRGRMTVVAARAAGNVTGAAAVHGGRACRPVLAGGHRLSLPPVSSSATARPASSRATGTRNGEQET
jgi:hypothetical protein